LPFGGEIASICHLPWQQYVSTSRVFQANSAFIRKLVFNFLEVDPKSILQMVAFFSNLPTKNSSLEVTDEDE
jgi:hypothetical protein